MYFANWPDHRVRALVERFGLTEEAEGTSASLTETKQFIHQYGKRRCDIEASVDNLTYHLGYAFRANKALDFPSLALTGMLAMPSPVFASIFHEKTDENMRTVLAMLRFALEREEVMTWCVDMGIWLQFKRVEELYLEEVTKFKVSAAFKRSGWRRRPVTSNQRYLAGEICRVLGMEKPKLTTRGQAVNFIDEHGGNPRFWNEPAKPADWWS